VSASALTGGTTLAEAQRIAAERLASAGIEEPRREARLVLASALGLDLAGLILRAEQPLGAGLAPLEAMLARRAAREPLSRILGKREFFGLDFLLGPDTLDPRHDTETLVEAVLSEAGTITAPRILDLGTGSGAILIALLSAIPGATGLGIDIAPGAVARARENAQRLGLGTRASFETGDLFERVEGRFEVVVSNPPYIPTHDLAGLDPEVRLHDPARALDGGADGLDFYRRIVAEAAGFLAPGGLLAFEVGAGQAFDVAALMTGASFGAPAIRKDLAGIERVVMARLLS